MSRLDALLSSLLAGRARGSSHALAAPAAAWLIAFLLGPVACVLILSFTRRGPYGALLWEFTTSNYSRVFDPAYLPVLVRSLSYAAATTALCLAAGYPLAYALSFHVRRAKGLLLILLMLPFWTSCLIAIYSWMILLGRQGLVNNLLISMGLTREPLQFLNTAPAVILGLVFFYLPFMVLPLYASLEKIPRALIEAAHDLGADGPKAFLRVTFPLSLPGAAAGAILTFIPCVGDYLTAEFLGGPQTYLIGNLVQNQFIMAQDWPFGGALAAGLVLLMSIGMGLYLRLEPQGSRATRA